MKRHLLATLAAGLLPLAALADEMPLWEVQVRMDGGGNAKFHNWLKEILDGKEEALAGGKEVLRVAGFENPETPGQDWVAELGGLANIDEVLGKVAADVEPDAKGRFKIGGGEGGNFIVWRNGPATLRFAGPAGNADKVVTPKVTLAGDAWLAGWVDLARLSKESIESTTLKLPEQLSFTLSGGGPGVTLEFRATLADPDAAEAARAFLDEVVKEFSGSEEGRATGLPKVEFITKEKTLTAKMIFNEAQLGELLQEVRKAVEDP